MLAPAAVTALYAADGAAHDVTAQMSDITCAPQMSVDVIRAPGNTGTLRWCTSLDWSVTARRFYVDDTMRAISALQAGGRLAVIYDDPAPSGVTGLLIPCRLSEDALAMLSLPNGSLASARVLWEPDPAALPRYIVAGVELDAAGNHTLPAGDAGIEYQIVTTAGAIDGTNRSVGLHNAGAVAAGADTSAADTARGWRLRTIATALN